MKRPTKSSRAPKPWVLLLFVGSAAVASVSLLSQFGGGDQGASVGESLASMFGDEPEADADSGEARPGRDLLALHGSFDASVPVRCAFAAAPDASPPAAAPAGETSPAGLGRWAGQDPPRLRVGVLMVSAGARRAVVDGVVVGLGDVVASSRIVAIEKDQVVVSWAGRRLTYDLENEHPREFRAELRRRANDQEPAGGTDPRPNQESDK